MYGSGRRADEAAGVQVQDEEREGMESVCDTEKYRRILDDKLRALIAQREAGTIGHMVLYGFVNFLPDVLPKDILVSMLKYIEVARRLNVDSEHLLILLFLESRGLLKVPSHSYFKEYLEGIGESPDRLNKKHAQLLSVLLERKGYLDDPWKPGNLSTSMQ